MQLQFYFKRSLFCLAYNSPPKLLPVQVLDQSSGICLYLHAGFENTFLNQTDSFDMSALGPTTSVRSHMDIGFMHQFKALSV